jgi:hypothetical protein
MQVELSVGGPLLWQQTSFWFLLQLEQGSNLTILFNSWDAGW